MSFQLLPSNNSEYLKQFYSNHTSPHDVVVHGRLLARGYEQFYFDEFYQAAQYVSANYHRPFLLIDVMPAYGYCPFKIITDVNAMSVLLVHDDEQSDVPQSEILHRLSIEQGVEDKVIILNHALEHEGLWYLSGCEHFDVVLIGNLFTVAGSQWKTIYPDLFALGERVIVGIANDTIGAEAYQEACDIFDAHDGVRLKTIKRDGYEARFYVFFQRKNSVKYCVLNDTKPHPPHAIESNYYRKNFIKDGIERPWYNGINLMTFRALGGVVPSEDYILDQLEALAPFTPKGANTIVQGKKLQVLP
jgi:hypothetical protein